MRKAERDLLRIGETAWEAWLAERGWDKCRPERRAGYGFHLGGCALPRTLPTTRAPL